MSKSSYARIICHDYELAFKPFIWCSFDPEGRGDAQFLHPMTLWNLFSCFVSFLFDFITGELRCDSAIPLMDESSSDSVCETSWTYKFPQKTNPALLCIRPKSIVSRMIKDTIGFSILSARGLKKHLRNVSTFMNLKFKHHYIVDNLKYEKFAPEL